MARACPACGRPNADLALKCLYCSVALPPAPEGRVPEPPTGDRRDTAPTSHLIILAPVPGGDDGKAPALAEAAAIGLYEARLALQARRYRLLRTLSSLELARSMSRALDAAGIPHHVLGEAELHSVALESLRGVSFRNAEIEVLTAGGTGRRVSGDDLLLLVRGEITRALHRETQLATPRGASQRLTPSYRLHVYTCTSGAFDLDPESFDWGALEEPPAASTPLNLKRLISAIRRRAPLAELDEGFALEPAVLSRKESGADPASILAQDSGSAGVLYDNEAQFRYYACWRYLVALASKRA